MNDTFYLPRFWRILKKALLERPMQMFGFTGAILLIVFIAYALFHMPIGRWDGIQRISFFLGLAVGGSFMASFAFGYFSTNAQGSSFLTLPGSHFEKWFCGVLVTCILYPCIFLLFFRIMDSAFVAWYHNHLDITKPDYKQLYKFIHIFSFDNLIARNVYSMFLIFTGVMLVGSLYFNKVSFIKVALVFCGTILVIYVVNLLMAKAMIDNVADAFPFGGIEVWLQKQTGQNVLPGLGPEIAFKTEMAFHESGSMELSPEGSRIVHWGLNYFLPAALWLISYVRLREKEF